MIVLLIVLIAVICIAGYFIVRLDEEHPTMNTLIFVSVVGCLIIPSLILFTAFDYFNIEDLNVIPATLPLILMGLLAIWATWGKFDNGSSATDNKKDDFVTDAMILTTVLSDKEKDNSDTSTSSGSHSSSSSSSHSNSDDLFFL